MVAEMSVALIHEPVMFPVIFTELPPLEQVSYMGTLRRIACLLMITTVGPMLFYTSHADDALNTVTHACRRGTNNK